MIMSILSDLDPKNARFGDDAAAATTGKMSWTAPLVLFSLAGLGLGAALYQGASDRQVSLKMSHPLSTVEPEPMVRGPVVANNTPPVTQTAMISNLAQDQKTVVETEPANEKKVLETKQESPAIKKNPDKKTAQSGSSGKLAQKAPKQTKTESKKGTQPSARDVEIITAIVQ